MSRAQRRRRSGTEGSNSQSYAYSGAGFRKILAHYNSFLSEHNYDITEKENQFCQRSLSQSFETPRGTLFHDCTFRHLNKRMETRNEIGVTTLIHLLLVPSAEFEILRGKVTFKELVDSFDERWDGTASLAEEEHLTLWLPDPQPDHSVGFSDNAFTKAQLNKLAPFLGGLNDKSAFKGTIDMLFPFFVVEAKSSKDSLIIADHQNGLSMTCALKGVVSLFQLAERAQQLHRKILGFSITYNHDIVYIFAHYPVISDRKVTYHRREVKTFSFADRDGSNRWISRSFVLAMYRDWVPRHFELLCSAVEALPKVNFNLSSGSISGSLDVSS
ncbi:uncharacterized protein BDV14DRAFT_202052 [Aspergillus stella-maris]|uniref:uncharacterized protein n=1 Tax=Aspergillus stella-maris TaxID=1810926 RepID=UPI003CCD88AB